MRDIFGENEWESALILAWNASLRMVWSIAARFWGGDSPLWVLLVLVPVWPVQVPSRSQMIRGA
jgi:hypothetical protein